MGNNDSESGEAARISRNKRHYALANSFRIVHLMYNRCVVPAIFRTSTVAVARLVRAR